MKRTIKKATVGLLTCLLVASSLVMHTGSSSAQINKDFSEPINLGSPIESIAIYDSTYGKEDGRDVMYTTVTGNPAIFQVIDLETKELLRKFPLEGSESSWSHITVPNGNVYIGGNGKLYEYSPHTKEVKNLGGIGESVVYGLSHDEDGRVYFGSYPNAKAGSYDPKTGEMRDYGSVAPDQSYSRSTAYHNGYLYLGIGIDGYLVKLDVETGEYEKIELPSHVVEGSSNIWQLDTAGKYIVAGIGGGNNALLFYDTVEHKWSEKYYTNNKGLRLIKGKPGTTDTAYFLQGTRLQEINLDTLDIQDTGVVFGTFIRNTSWVEVADDPDLPGLSLVTIQFGGGVTFMNLETKKVKTVSDYPIAGNPIPIQTLEKGPDGNLYVSGYPGGVAAKFNPETSVSTMFSLGQAEGMAALGDKMYMGVYSGAHIFELDVTANTNPKQIFTIPNQDRPFVMTPADDTLFIGTIPNYGQLGGSLTVLRPNSELEPAVYENVVHNQSIAGLAVRDGKLYGSTTVAGGLGIAPTETEAKIFVWDIDSGEKTMEFVPEIPGATVQPKMISGMKLGPDGLLWAAADGSIFAMDPDTLEIVKSANIYPEVKNYGMWRPVHIRWGADGLMYTTLAGKLTVIDPISLDFETLSSTQLMTIGNDGNIYYTSGPYVMKIEVAGKTTLEAALEVIHQQNNNGNITHSLYEKLINSVKQAIHHRDKDRMDQAEKHLQDTLEHLNKAKPTDITPEAYAEIEKIIHLVNF